MAKNSEIQLVLDFQRPATADTESPHTAASAEVGARIIFGEHSAPATIYCLEDRRAAKMGKEDAVHFAAILDLVAHIK